MDAETHAALVFNALPHWGPIRLRRLMETHGCSISDCLKMKKSELIGIRDIGTKAIQSLLQWDSIVDTDKEIRKIGQYGLRFVGKSDSEYPERLRHLPDAPIGLYWKGDLGASHADVAIIGSRRTTPYGRKIANEWARTLSSAGVTVISGMARGIDAEAHRGALEERGSTIAVMGSGFDRIYPPEHLELFEQISVKGAVISEFSFGTAASKTSFPMRNRIVSGIARVVLVVETDVKGGSMITAKFAAEQGKTVCAVPGRIDSTASAGCHQLIRDGAILVSKPDEILEELDWNSQPELFASLAAESKQATGPESEILKELQGGEIISTDAMVDKTSLTFSAVSSSLMMLELQGLVARRSDGAYELA